MYPKFVCSVKKKTFLIRSIKDYYINSASNIGRKKKKVVF